MRGALCPYSPRMSADTDIQESRQYDLLLLTATEAEEKQLLAAADQLKVSYKKTDGLFARSLIDFGKLGDYRVAAFRSKMGALDFGGSASAAQLYKAVTKATGIIAVGMAFGISNKFQAIGDVLVSEGLFPYDDRDVVSVNGKPEYRYYEIDAKTGGVRASIKATDWRRGKFRAAKPSLLRFFQRPQKAHCDFKVHVGALLSGSARIYSVEYRDMLLNQFLARGKPIIGGEMEAVGLLSCSDPQAPWWIVVKGICDFADAQSDQSDRVLACQNAAQFVLASLCKATTTDKL